jgi:hypothetical protein
MFLCLYYVLSSFRVYFKWVRSHHFWSTEVTTSPQRQCVYESAPSDLLLLPASSSSGSLSLVKQRSRAPSFFYDSTAASPPVQSYLRNWCVQKRFTPFDKQCNEPRASPPSSVVSLLLPAKQRREPLTPTPSSVVSLLLPRQAASSASIPFAKQCCKPEAAPPPSHSRTQKPDAKQHSTSVLPRHTSQSSFAVHSRIFLYQKPLHLLATSCAAIEPVATTSQTDQFATSRIISVNCNRNRIALVISRTLNQTSGPSCVAREPPRPPVLLCAVVSRRYSPLPKSLLVAKIHSRFETTTVAQRSHAQPAHQRTRSAEVTSTHGLCTLPSPTNSQVILLTSAPPQGSDPYPTTEWEQARSQRTPTPRSALITKHR